MDEKPTPQKRWSWWNQFRDISSLTSGLALLAVETYRGTYNPIAMTFVAVFFGIFSSGVLARMLLGRIEGEKK